MASVANLVISEYSSLFDYKSDINSKNLKVLYLNARSIKNKLDQLEIIAEDIFPDIIVITETWLSKEDEL